MTNPTKAEIISKWISNRKLVGFGLSPNQPQAEWFPWFYPWCFVWRLWFMSVKAPRTPTNTKSRRYGREMALCLPPWPIQGFGRQGTLRAQTTKESLRLPYGGTGTGLLSFLWTIAAANRPARSYQKPCSNQTAFQCRHFTGPRQARFRRFVDSFNDKSHPIWAGNGMCVWRLRRLDRGRPTTPNARAFDCRDGFQCRRGNDDNRNRLVAWIERVQQCRVTSILRRCMVADTGEGIARHAAKRVLLRIPLHGNLGPLWERSSPRIHARGILVIELVCVTETEEIEGNRHDGLFLFVWRPRRDCRVAFHSCTLPRPRESCNTAKAVPHFFSARASRKTSVLSWTI